MLSPTCARVMFGQHVDSALSIVKKATSDFEVLGVWQLSEFHHATVFTSGCYQALIFITAAADKGQAMNIC